MVLWTRTWSVPATLLIAGEYAITREGGTGVAAAVAPRARGWLTARRAPGKESDAPHGALFCGASMEIRALGGGGLDLVWPHDPLPLLDHIVELLEKESTITAPQSPTGVVLHGGVDTRQFFDTETGQKLGLGSSAAAAVLATALLRCAAGLETWESPRGLRETTAMAIHAHRRSQGGRGSGYDVTCSAAGGVIRFTGGETPQGTPVMVPEGIHLATMGGGAPVRSSLAVAQFDAAFPRGTPEEREFITASNDVVDALCSARDADTFLSIMDRSRHFSEKTGERIGVPATMAITPGCPRGDGWVARCSGAGNERIILASRAEPRRRLPGEARPVQVEHDGIREHTGGWHAAAQGKLLLFGEHAAVYGHPSLGIALEQALHVTLIPGIRWSTPQLHDPRVPPFLRLLEEELRLPPGELLVESSIPQGGGFGSSAALAVACTRLAGVSETRKIWLQAHRLETVFHGTPSGIDTGLSVLNSSLLFQGRDHHGLPVAEPCVLPRMYLVAGALPRQQDTAALVAQVAQRRSDRREDTDALLQNLGALATAAAHSSLQEIGRYAREAHTLLGHLGVSTPELDHVILTGEAAGALGGKLSGAGGGGAFFLVCEDPEVQDRVLQAVIPLMPPGSSVFTATTGTESTGADGGAGPRSGTP